MIDWLDVVANREILSGVPVFYYPRYGGLVIPDEVISADRDEPSGQPESLESGLTKGIR